MAHLSDWGPDGCLAEKAGFGAETVGEEMAWANLTVEVSEFGTNGVPDNDIDAPVAGTSVS